MRTTYIHFVKMKYIMIIGLFLFLLDQVSAQDLKKEIYVVSSYKPKIADAEKISTMPSITDTMKFETNIDYTLLPSRIKTDYSPRNIKPAKMVGTPLDKLYKSYLKIGLGNYVTPLVEYSIHNLRSKEYAIGAYIFHKSSHTKMELDNGAKVPAGYGRNELSVYGKKFYKDINLTADIGMNTHRIRYYGYNIDNFPDSVPELEVDDIKQSFFHVFGVVGAHSANADSSALDYVLDLRGDYYRDHFKNKEPHFNVSGSISYPIRTFRFGLDGTYNYYQFNTNIRKESVLMFHPFAMKRKPEWEVKLAAKLIFEKMNNRSRGYLFPDASIRFQIIEKALVTNIGVTGYLENNNYHSLTSENPFLVPGTAVENTLHRFIAYGGIEGQLSRKMAYRLDVTFDAMEDALFYINDTNSLLQNQFDIVYDDADLIKYHGELAWMPLSNLSLFLKGNYYSYKMTAENKPWQKPTADFTFAVSYNFKEKIFAELDYLVYGKRYAKNYNETDNPYLLNPVHDLNLKLEYKYSNILSGFIHLYNLLSQKYYLWNNYPSQRLNVLIGVTYKF
jgi:hypothetical protein